MSKVKLIANKEMYFDGDTVKQDHPFYSDEKFVEILLLSNSARRADAEIDRPAGKRRRQYNRRDMVAESPQ